MMCVFVCVPTWKKQILQAMWSMCSRLERSEQVVKFFHRTEKWRQVRRPAGAVKEELNDRGV